MTLETLKGNIENLKDSFNFITTNTNEHLEKINEKFILKTLKNLITSIYYDLTDCVFSLDEFENFDFYKEVKEEINEFESKIYDLEFNIEEFPLLEIIELPKYIEFTLKSLNIGVKFILKEAETKVKELEKKENKPIKKKETKIRKSNTKLL